LVKMNLAEEASQLLYPEKELEHDVSVKYHNKFKPYNANVKIIGKRLEFNLSKKWKTVSKEIQIGLIQSLLLKIFKNKKNTTNIDLYNIFMKKVHIAAPKTNIDPLLEESFDRVNEKYFYGLIEKPNLVWGNSSIRKLGSYEYGSDTITISRIFEKVDEKIVDYIIYHEALHKKHKFMSKNGRNYHHTTLFKKKEKEFENSEEMERNLRRILKQSSRKRLFGKLFGF